MRRFEETLGAIRAACKGAGGRGLVGALSPPPVTDEGPSRLLPPARKCRGAALTGARLVSSCSSRPVATHVRRGLRTCYQTSTGRQGVAIVIEPCRSSGDTEVSPIYLIFCGREERPPTI